MKRSRNCVSPFFAVLAFTLAAAALFAAVAPVLADNAAGRMKDFAKSAAPGETVRFSPEDLRRNTVTGDAPTELLVAGLPAPDVGALMLGRQPLSEGSVIPAAALDEMAFVPAAGGAFRTELCFLPLWGGASFDAAGEPLTVTIRFSDQPDYPPEAAALTLETYRDMPIAVTLAAYDRESAALTYDLIAFTGSGELKLENGALIYTPAPGKTGTASFTYYARDGAGNTSDPALATILVRRPPSGAAAYADLSDPTSACAAARLADAGVFTGEQLGGVRLIGAGRGFSRAEFAALCTGAFALEPSSEAAVTLDGSDWQSPYAAEALAASVVDGRDVGAPVTGRSAAFLAMKLLRRALDAETDTDTATDALDCGILRSRALLDRELTREEALDLVDRARSVFRGRSLGWKQPSPGN